MRPSRPSRPGCALAEQWPGIPLQPKGLWATEAPVSIPLAELRKSADSLDRDAVTVTYCNKGVTGNAAQNLLLNRGFRRVYNLSGGMNQYTLVRKMQEH